MCFEARHRPIKLLLIALAANHRVSSTNVHCYSISANTPLHYHHTPTTKSTLLGRARAPIHHPSIHPSIGCRRATYPDSPRPPARPSPSALGTLARVRATPTRKIALATQSTRADGEPPAPSAVHSTDDTIYQETLDYVRVRAVPRSGPDLGDSSESLSATPSVAPSPAPTASHPDDPIDTDPDDSTTATTSATTATVSSNSSTKRKRAKMAARTMSKPLRKSYVGMVAGLASTVGFGQAMFLKATYQSPPDAKGPRCGVERPRPGVERAKPETLSSASGHVTRIVSANGPASSAASAALSAALDATVDQVKTQLQSADLESAIDKSADPPVANRKRILIIGDSLVSGVGGESSFDDGPSDGPALPRQVARYLSEMLNVDVQWNAMSLTGGDVRMLKRKIVPMLTRERERGTIGDISAVVLVTGVNDWKRISPIRTANKFKEDLAEFVNNIREQVGEECSVFLPAIPGVHHTPRFHEPLRSILIFLNDYWDSQKVQLSRTMKNVYFVGQPPNEAWGSNPLQFFSTLDRVHPSELGYQRWAERIAEHMVTSFRKGVQQAANSATGAVANAKQIASNAAGRATQQTNTATDPTKQDDSQTPKVGSASGMERTETSQVN